MAGYGQYEWFAPAWVEGLKRLDLEVHFFDWSPCLLKGVLGKIEDRLAWGPGILRVNSELKRITQLVSPDIVLIHCGFPVYPETVAELAKICWVTAFHHDNPFGDFGSKNYFKPFKQSIPLYSSHHVIRQENISDYQRLGVKHVRLLMTYYIPWLHYPRHMDQVSSNSKLDVVFIGHLERDKRIQYVTDVLEADLPLRLFGSPEWNRYLPNSLAKDLPPTRPLIGDDYPRAISKAKICLAFYSGANKDHYAYRVFEIPACGGFLLAERTPAMQELYKEGNEAEYFDSSQELINKIRYYLQHDNTREKIARQGHERCLKSGYDIVSRLKQWLSDIQEFQKNDTSKL